MALGQITQTKLTSIMSIIVQYWKTTELHDTIFRHFSRNECRLATDGWAYIYTGWVKL